MAIIRLVDKAGRSVPRPATIAALATAISIITVHWAFGFYDRRSQLSMAVPSRSISQQPISTPLFKFVAYEQSPWEADWHSHRKSFQGNPPSICKKLDTDAKRAAEWVNSISDGKFRKKSRVFSHFVYESTTCLGAKKRLKVPVEPVAGHFRHPYALQLCKPESVEAVQVEDRGHILLSGISTKLFHCMYPGRKYMFDLGSSAYVSGTQWLVDSYRQSHGVEFDEIYAWEMQPISGTQYWSQVPEDVFGKLRFFNTGVHNNKTAKSYIFNVIAALYKPGDFVAIKLDIDNSFLELGFMQDLQNNSRLRSMIGEMMFEMHYNSLSMQQYFGQPPTKYAEVYELFNSLRKAGLRLHYWP